MRKLLTGVLALVALIAMSAVAFGQAVPGTHTLKMTPSPTKAGTKSKPKDLSKLRLNISNNRASATTADKIVIAFPKDIKINAKDYPTCAAAKIDNAPTKDKICPKGSLVGKGVSKAVVNPGPTESQLNFETKFYVGGSKALAIYLNQTGGNVQRALEGKIKGSKIEIAITEDLQQPAPGVYSALTDIDVTFGSAKAGKGAKRHGLFQSAGCSGSWTWKSAVSYVPNPNPPAVGSSNAESKVACKK